MKDFEDYNAGRFSGIANTELGRNLWAFLNDHDTVLAMEVASDLEKPAVAGIEERLLDKFGEAVLPDRVKQLIGHMVRQIMEREGFVVDQNNVKINSVPFSKGTRYRRPEWYRLHVFRSSADPRDLCITDTRSGEKLPSPPDGAKWRYWNSFATILRGYFAYGIKPTEVRKIVMADGYARRRMERILRPT